MKLATLRNDRRDGRLVVVSKDLTRGVGAESIASTLLDALERWSETEPGLRELAERLDRGPVPAAFDFDPRRAAAPLPRAPQWCDGSAFLAHGALMQQAFNLPPIPDVERIPLMYQGTSDDMMGPHDDILALDEAWGIDFEGEFGVIVGDVPMGCSAARAGEHIRLLVQINDVSFRAFAPREMRTGFGFFQSKPSSSFAPVAVTPDELGDRWRSARVHLPLHVELNGRWFGEPDGGAMHFGFDELVAHAAATRRLTAGTVIGSGTVSNGGGARGSACIAERRAMELVQTGAPETSFLVFGDRVRMEARCNGQPVFGAIDQRIVRAASVEP
ncbi:MAG: fumarylacetoacetate hydrolase family protein [Gemmatimonadaceae bacterium]